MMNVKLFILLACTIFLSSCTDSITENQPEKENIDYSEELSTYFPTNYGTLLKYSIDTLNSEDNTYLNIGNRLLSLDSKKNYRDTEYFVCNQLFEIDGLDIERTLRFRIADNSILFFADTCRVSESIPDSLSGQLSIYIEPEINMLEFPLVKNELWHVINATVDFGAFKFSILDISGEYIGNEILTLDDFTDPLFADKIRYQLDVNIPDLSNPFISEIQTYYAEAWFVPGIGIAKLEGCSLFINPVSGMHIDFSDTNKVSRHTLISTK